VTEKKTPNNPRASENNLRVINLRDGEKSRANENTPRVINLREGERSRVNENTPRDGDRAPPNTPRASENSPRDIEKNNTPRDIEKNNTPRDGEKISRDVPTKPPNETSRMLFNSSRFVKPRTITITKFGSASQTAGRLPIRAPVTTPATPVTSPLTSPRLYYPLSPKPTRVTPVNSSPPRRTQSWSLPTTPLRNSDGMPKWKQAQLEREHRERQRFEADRFKKLQTIQKIATRASQSGNPSVSAQALAATLPPHPNSN